MILAAAICVLQQVALEGRVVDGAGPVARARVILGELGRATLYYNTPEEMFVGTPGLAESEVARYSAVRTSDAEGQFSVEGLAAGEYSLIAAEPRRGIAFTTLRLEAGAAVKTRLALQPLAFVKGTIEGLDFDPQLHVLELKPVTSRVNIAWIPRLLQGPNSWSFQSVGLPALPDWKLTGGQVVLEQDFRATLFSVSLATQPAATSEARVAVASGASVVGRVLDTSGAALRNVSVVAACNDKEFGALTDGEGRYRIRGLGQGIWRLDALRYGMRELPGCGNGPQEWSGSQEFVVGTANEQKIDLRVNASRAPPRVGELAPEFSALALDGRALKLSELRGKLVLIDFWATWCGMCRADFPRLLATYEAHAPSGRFEVVGVSVDEDCELVRRFVASRGLRWPQLGLGIAAKNAVAQLYNVNSTPSTVLIGADGKVIALNLTGEALRAKIDELLAAK